MKILKSKTENGYINACPKIIFSSTADTGIYNTLFGFGMIAQYGAGFIDNLD